MDERMLDALKASIAKWERNAQVENLSEARVQIADCPLCDLFRFAYPVCNGCPVAQTAGETCCDNTPYPYAYATRRVGNIEIFRKAALAEVEFLKSLLPEGERDGPSP